MVIEEIRIIWGSVKEKKMIEMGKKKEKLDDIVML